MTTKRKPYVRPMTSTGGKKLPFYRFYMLREGTAPHGMVQYRADLRAIRA